MIKRKQFVLALLGPAGSGKGTQAQLLVRCLGRRTHYCYAGALLRAFVKRYESEAAHRLKAIMQRGDLTPGFIAAYSWKGIILKNVKAGDSVIFDGSPRTIREAEEMDEALRFIGFPAPVVLYLTLTTDEAYHRLLQRGRHDDTKRAIAARLRFFKKDVMPVIRFYQKQGRLITINGDQPVAGVWADIKKALHV